jgi:hypothetical protein
VVKEDDERAELGVEPGGETTPGDDWGWNEHWIGWKRRQIGMGRPAEGRGDRTKGGKPETPLKETVSQQSH